ncbi:MAG: hypothetical protein IFK93_10380 [Acidobacteria bacterium]|nr:hypothetical protein [Candidatus Sulfomarinibacter kjeldsenii]
MEESSSVEVVLRFRDGHLTRAVLTRDFTPLDFAVEAESEDGEKLQVNISDLKAVFFLKEPGRREAELQIGAVIGDPPPGAPSRVEFFDGEIIHGHVKEYRMENSGFFLYPTSPESNNQKIFVVARSINTLSLEG